MKKMVNGFQNRFDTNYYRFARAVPTIDGGYTSMRVKTKPYNVSMTGTAIRAHCLQKTDGTARLFAASATKIYELTDTTTWSDVSAGGAAYTTTGEWNFCQYGDATIAVSIENATQASTSGAFAALSGSPPKAKFCCTQNLAVILAHYNDGSLYTDGWWASDVGDYTTWTPAASNDAAYGRLLQTPGPITGMVSFKNKVYMFKENSFYVMEYVGAPIYYQVSVVDWNVGATRQGVIAVAGDYLVFANRGGFYRFDGQTVTQISRKSSSLDRLAGAVYNEAGCGNYYDAKNGNIYFYSPTGAGCVYNVNNDMFGLPMQMAANGGRTIVMGTEAAFNSSLPDSLGTLAWPAYMAVNSSNSDLNLASSIDGADMLFYTSVHGNYKRKTTWTRFTPVMEFDYDDLYVATFLVGRGSNVTHSLDSDQDVLYDPAPIVVTPTFNVDKTFRCDFMATANFASFSITLGNSSGAAFPTVLYDYILDEVPAGTD